jgi:hypothetical protein
VGAGQDFRVRSDNGNLTVSTAVAADNIALVTGSELSISGQALGSDMFIDDDLIAGSNLVLLSNGNIFKNSGSTITAPSIGLGAAGRIGSIEGAFDFNAELLALNAGESFLAPSTPPDDVPSVTSAGVTVNAQGAVPDPDPDPDPDPGPGPEPTPDPDPVTNPVPEVITIPDDKIVLFIDPSVLAQNNVDLVEEDIEELLEIEKLLSDLLDPQIPALGWWNDEDFLRRKFRR